MQARIQGSGTKSFDSEDFGIEQQVDYIAKDKTATDTEEEPIIGILEFDGNAKASNVANNSTFYNDSVYDKQTGTLTFSSASNTSPSDVAKGKTFYNDLYTKSTGTLEFDGNVKASEVEKGKTYYDTDLHEKKIGTMIFTGNAQASDVELGTSFYNDSIRDKKTGTLTFNGSARASDVEKGFTFYDTDLHTKKTGTLAFNGNAVAGNILSGKTAYTTNLRSSITGNITDRGAINVTLNSGGSYTIPSGYHNGSGKVTENSPYIQTKIDSSAADASKIWQGYTAYVNGNFITGTGSQPILSYNLRQTCSYYAGCGVGINGTPYFHTGIRVKVWRMWNSNYSITDDILKNISWDTQSNINGGTFSWDSGYGYTGTWYAGRYGSNYPPVVPNSGVPSYWKGAYCGYYSVYSADITPTWVAFHMYNGVDSYNYNIPSYLAIVAFPYFYIGQTLVSKKKVLITRNSTIYGWGQQAHTNPIGKDYVILNTSG